MNLISLIGKLEASKYEKVRLLSSIRFSISLRLNSSLDIYLLINLFNGDSIFFLLSFFYLFLLYNIIPFFSTTFFSLLNLFHS